MYSATETTPVETFLPEENKVVLKSGRVISYDWLVLAMGLKEDMGAIKGFEEALADIEHPVYASKDHSSWRST